MTELLRYELYGLRVDSQLPIGVPIAIEPATAAATDLVVTIGQTGPEYVVQPSGTVVAEVEWPDGARYGVIESPAGDYLIWYSDVCLFEVSADLRTAVVHLVAPDRIGTAAILAAGALLAIILQLSGELVLHASAVQIGDAALAFIGFSGMGKSTMAALCCAEGAPLITDDVLRVDVSGADARCHLGSPELRLRPNAAALIDQFGSRPPSRQTSDERNAVLADRAQRNLLPLAAIVVPRPDRQRHEVAVQRLDPIESLLTLVQYPRLLGWADEKTHAQLFANLAELSERVPVFAADIPWGPPFPDGIVAALLDGIGLGQSASSL